MRCALRAALYQAVDGIRSEWAASFRGEHIPRVGILPMQLAQCPQLIPADRVSSRLAILGAADMQRGVPAPFDL
jgi:hypothetical protein